MDNNQTQQPQAAEKPSSLVTSLATITIVLGSVGLLVSFIPCFGAFAMFIAIPASILGIITVIVAKTRNRPRTFPVIALTIAVLGAVISYLQYKGLEAAAEEIDKANIEIQKKDGKSLED